MGLLDFLLRKKPKTPKTARPRAKPKVSPPPLDAKKPPSSVVATDIVALMQQGASPAEIAQLLNVPQLRELKTDLQAIKEHTAQLAEMRLQLEELAARTRKAHKTNKEHFRFQRAIWQRHDTHAYQAVLRLMGDAQAAMHQVEQVIKQPEVPHSELVRQVEQLQLRTKPLQLVRLLLEKGELSYEEIAAELGIAESNARGLVSRVSSSGVHLAKTVQGNKTIVGIEPSFKPALREVLNQTLR
jgi:DNA-binding CsgD family transcriptional regulator